MKVFLSWSGGRSNHVAQALHDWLPLILQSVQPWFSGYDIDAGARWSSEIARELEESRFAIICLTPENLKAEWLNFEAGALAKSVHKAYVVPFLFGFEPTELRGPLVQFQAVRANAEDMWRLLQTMNRALGDNGIQEERLKQLFDGMWPSLQSRFTQIAQLLPKMPHEDRPSGVGFESDMKFDSLTTRIGHLEETIRTLLSGPPQSAEAAAGKPVQNVFLVHGRNEGVRETVARFLEKLGTVAIILQEQPNQGRTVIEKFETFAEAGYAVVLMTGDDIGGLVGDSNEKARARQNVIFELGYFVAKLGRSRVCLLHEKGVEIPSDLSGVLYITLDSEGMWRFSLARELKAAGIAVDLNKVL